MWRKLKTWCRHSLTIAWARLVMLAGIAFGVLQAVDVSPALPARWVPLYLVAFGIVTELARRRTL